MGPQPPQLPTAPNCASNRMQVPLAPSECELQRAATAPADWRTGPASGAATWQLRSVGKTGANGGCWVRAAIFSTALKIFTSMIHPCRRKRPVPPFVPLPHQSPPCEVPYLAQHLAPCLASIHPNPTHLFLICPIFCSPPKSAGRYRLSPPPSSLLSTPACRRLRFSTAHPPSPALRSSLYACAARDLLGARALFRKTWRSVTFELASFRYGTRCRLHSFDFLLRRYSAAPVRVSAPLARSRDDRPSVERNPTGLIRLAVGVDQASSIGDKTSQAAAMVRTTLRAGLGGLLSLLLLSPVQAFYIPGWSIKSYKEGDLVPLLVNKVYSDNTQLQYAYYDLPFVCHPTGQHKAGGGLLSGQSIPLNLGEVLRGDRIIASDMELAMGRDKACNLLCSKEIVDNLPGATSFVTSDKTKKYYAAGFKLGHTEISHSTGRAHYFLYNHHTIVIRYRKAPGRAGDRGEKVIVGFEVYPKSIGHENRRDSTGCPTDLQHVDGGFELYVAPNRTSDLAARYPDPSYFPDALDDDDDGAGGSITIPYTYSVYFREDDSIEWSHRWDLYFVNQEEGSRIHWLAIVNSLIICGLLTGIVMIILAKTIRTDIKGYREAAAEDGKLRKRKLRSGARTPKEKAAGLLDQGADVENDADVSDDDEALDDVTGWKLLHADVFRTPRSGNLLAPLVGSGMQLLFMAVGLVFLSALGVLNPSFRGGFISVGVGLFIFAGLFSGYFSARVFKSFDGKDYKSNALVTALLFPGLTFGLVFMLNLFVWAQASSTAIPFGTLIAILLLWLCIQVPLVLAGSYYGYLKAGAWEHPTRTAALPRQVPHQAWYIKSLQSILLAGLIPFAVIFIELLFVFQSVWQDKSGYYYVFGFLAVVSVILVVTIAEVTVVTVYIQLCSENYHWWWQSFLVGGGSAVWVFGYCAWYYLFKLHISGVLRLRAADGHGGLLERICVCATDIRVGIFLGPRESSNDKANS
ncbi:Transmembrane 9 superfamily member 7 [Tolypocladium ophioglossoides CBS 100239]|uniref:Transmembrane 9 superfamily member n=1 Tax=Tolypocladium ophioglossoides (strain CBS 100239) TaxID=1163406 RepID=A0A0L0N1M2_TOLOC|nr:Transmembrane 9 superfamily member 7 [Tolypocladium ophioglossoides CBS 100239]